MEHCKAGWGERGGGRGRQGEGESREGSWPSWPSAAHLEGGGSVALKAGCSRGEEVSCVWDETLSLTNAKNVQGSIWFCFFQFPPLSTACVLRRGLQPSLDVPTAKRPCQPGSSGLCVCEDRLLRAARGTRSSATHVRLGKALHLRGSSSETRMRGLLACP